MTKILFVEDDANLGLLLKENLTNKGFDTIWCRDGSEAFARFKTDTFNLCLLDVMLPVTDGFTLAKQIRTVNATVPIIFLTARGMHEDKVKGFEFGCDDYVTKPFNMDVLVAMLDSKIKYVVSHDKSEISKFGDMEHHPNTHSLLKNNKKIELTILENRILLYFLKNVNSIISRDDLMMVVWGYNSDVNTRTLDMHIVRLRKKIEDNPDRPQFLQTVRGVGYRFHV